MMNELFVVGNFFMDSFTEGHEVFPDFSSFVRTFFNSLSLPTNQFFKIVYDVVEILKANNFKLDKAYKARSYSNPRFILHFIAQANID